MVSYKSQNLISGEFKSWRAGEYRQIKDGDKSFQVFAIDGRKYASDPEFEGMCRINREESIAIPSFGANRMYHVVMIYDPTAETISTTVTDNLHDKTFFVCSGMLDHVGMFYGIDRIVLVAEPAANAYIEGSIDNVVLSVPASTIQSGSSITVKQTITQPQSGKAGNAETKETTATKSPLSPAISLTGIAMGGFIVHMLRRRQP